MIPKIKISERTATTILTIVAIALIVTGAVLLDLRVYIGVMALILANETFELIIAIRSKAAAEKSLNELKNILKQKLGEDGK